VSKELEKISQRVGDLVETMSSAFIRTQTEIGTSTQQSRNLQKDVNKLQETVALFQRDMQKLTAGQDLLMTNVEKILATMSRFEFANPGVPKATREAVSTSSGAVASNAAATPAAEEAPAEGSKLKMAEYLKQKKSVFDVRVLNAFINAAKATSQMLLMKEVKFIRPQPLPPGKFVTFAHAARMKLSKGEGSGYMGVGFKANHINEAVSIIFGITPTEVTAAMLNDLTKEFCNQVFGQAKTALQKEGINYSITFPEVALGSQLDIRQTWGDAYLVLIFELEGKEFYIMFW
jgi:CheY-specific phosphatase CheX